MKSQEKCSGCGRILELSINGKHMCRCGEIIVINNAVHHDLTDQDTQKETGKSFSFTEAVKKQSISICVGMIFLISIILIYAETSGLPELFGNHSDLAKNIFYSSLTIIFLIAFISLSVYAAPVMVKNEKHLHDKLKIIFVAMMLLLLLVYSFCEVDIQSLSYANNTLHRTENSLTFFSVQT